MPLQSMTPAAHIVQALAHLRKTLDAWRPDPDDQPAENARWADLLDLTEALEKLAASVPTGAA